MKKGKGEKKNEKVPEWWACEWAPHVPLQSVGSWVAPIVGPHSDHICGPTGKGWSLEEGGGS